MTSVQKFTVILSIISFNALASTPTFDHNSKLGMCTGLSKIANISINQKKIANALDRSEGEEKLLGALSYGGGYAMGLVDMYKKVKPETKSVPAVAKQIFEQTGCKVYQ